MGSASVDGVGLRDVELLVRSSTRTLTSGCEVGQGTGRKCVRHDSVACGTRKKLSKIGTRWCLFLELGDLVGQLGVCTCVLTPCAPVGLHLGAPRDALPVTWGSWFATRVVS